jgi:hypothetical protein
MIRQPPKFGSAKNEKRSDKVEEASRLQRNEPTAAPNRRTQARTRPGRLCSISLRLGASSYGAILAMFHSSFSRSGRSSIRSLPALAALAAATAFTAHAAPRAFPGAEGFGASATGGRGGRVVYVTNTRATGHGSLQWALDQPGKKYVLFRTSGVINHRIHLNRGDVTIAGQTSPGGITVRGFVTDEDPFQDQEVKAPDSHAENWILQHIRIRPGANGPSDDGLRLRYTRNAIVDHVSIGNATDEAMEISYSNRLSIQNCILAETVGSHAFYGGMLMNYSNPTHGFALDQLSIHHNLFARIQGRLPEASRESFAAARSTMRWELACNLYWDPSFFIAIGSDTNVVTDNRGEPFPIYHALNLVNNQFHTRSQFPYGMFDDAILRNPASARRNSLYVQGNRMDSLPDRSGYSLFYCCNDFPQAQPEDSPNLAQARDRRHPFPRITYTPVRNLRKALVAGAGAFPRDPMDRRLLRPIQRNRIEPSRSDRNPADDTLIPAYEGNPPPPPQDTDLDGMPDDWETAHNLDPRTADPNSTSLSSAGYTNLEVYLHERSARVVSGP